MMDVETTGLDWTTDDITEIALVAGRLVEGEEGPRSYLVQVLETFHTLIQPRPWLIDRAKEVAESVTGISVEELLIAPKLLDVVPAISKVFADHDGALLAAYNGRFDQQFVAGAILRAARDLPFAVPTALRANMPILDPCIWSRKIDRYASGKDENGVQQGAHKLMTVARRYNLVAPEDVESAHRADFDARVAFDILAHFAGDLDERGHMSERRLPEELDDLMDWQETARAEWAANFFGKWMPKKRRAERIERARAAVVDEAMQAAERREAALLAY